MITDKKPAVEFQVLISYEDIKEFNADRFAGFNERMRLKEYQKKILNGIEMIESDILAISIFFLRFLHRIVSIWCTFMGVAIVGA